uniref:Late embryogenesis abundant protein LEA-2 subgroup domain-containing protein n=1 Tax=Brassica oleracea var. oleracea TaxID=109376 RepID=A0A0D3AIN6_BRAOL
MTDRVFPASKPPTATDGVPPAPPPAPAAVNGNGTANGTANQKPQTYIPANRPVYRPQPYSRRHHHQSRPSCRRVCCCCCFWSILIFLLLALMAAIAATAVYVIYRPRPPSFSVPSLRISRVNLTTASDTSVSHLSSFFNFTLLSENPNGHLTFSYDPFAVTVKSAKSGQTVANGTVPAFFSDNKNKTSFRGVIAASAPARELDPEEARRLKSDLARARVGFEIVMRTMVKLRMGKVKSEGVEIRVTCQGFEGTVPKGKTPTVATSKRTKCKSDLSVKIRTSRRPCDSRSPAPVRFFISGAGEEGDPDEAHDEDHRSGSPFSSSWCLFPIGEKETDKKMTDRVFPASKPPTATDGVPPAPPPAPAAVNGNGTANGTANQKPQTYIPANRPVYRPQPYSRRHHHQSRPSCRRVCCCCCFWSILIFLLLALMAAIAATAVYVIYRPRPPSFSVPSLRISRVNLTTASDTSVSHLSSFFNFTLLSENPNGHLTFSYDPFAVTVKSAKSGQTVANGTVPAFFSDNKNKTSFRGVIAASAPARELDPEEARRLKSDLARARVGFEIVMRTMVKLRMGKVKSEGVEIRVTCQGFEGTVPKGKTPTVATSKRTKCKSDLSVKVWEWSF